MIFDLEQNIKINNDVELNLGTEAEREHYKIMDSIDRLNYGRIDLYLNTFGYPDKDSVSTQASATPWLVIHHSNLSKRLRHYITLNKAYKNGNIDVMQFDLYLGRTYQMKFGKHPKWEGPYKPEEKIEWLINELKID